MVNNELYIGSVEDPILYFPSATLRSVSGSKTVDLVGNELSIDLLDPHVEYQWIAQQYLETSDDYALETSDGFILCGFWNVKPADIPYGTPVWYFTDGRVAGKYYFHYAERVGRTQWLIHAISIIGLLDMEMHRGGVYTGLDFAHVLTEFLGGSVGESSNGFTAVTGGMVDCLVADALAITTVHGLLPYATKRANLHQLIFDYCVNLSKADDGTLIFSYLQPSLAPPVIPVDRVFISGEVEYEQPVTDVELTEYTYIYDETVEPVKVYDNSTAPHTEGEALVLFKTPIRPETISVSEPTMTVRDANEISAYVTGHGIISAVPYQIQERVLSRSVENAVLRKTVSVDGLTLTNPLNSSNLLDRLFDYYTQQQTVSNSIEVRDEKPGELYRFVDPYGDEKIGFIRSMEWLSSGITKADCEIVTNYTPAGISTNMQNVILLQGSGVWEVPAAIRERDNPYIRAVLIGGGQGGHGGYTGEESERRPDKPGAGGEGGEGGEGGKTLTVDINVENITSIVYDCGVGGEGGLSDEAGAYGSDTYFGEYTSALGAPAPGGILNYMDGKFYARRGRPGLSGAAGGKGAEYASNVPTPEELAAYGSPGESVTFRGEVFEGGDGGRSVYATQNNAAGWAMGGGGGGAAPGAIGHNGTDGHVAWQAVIGGWGGKGGTSPHPGADAQYAGTGGDGGHGGGGGGAPGTAGSSMVTAPTGYTGKGGPGSPGGRGAAGAVLIYY